MSANRLEQDTFDMQNTLLEYDPPTDLRFAPYFTVPGVDPYSKLRWEQRSIDIGDFRQEGVWFPTTWSQRSSDITASKYFRMMHGGREYDLRNVIDRVVIAITNWGTIDRYFDVYTANNFAAELTYILVNQMASFNSPVWFNIGVPGVAQQSSACFILNVEDNMPSILNWYTEEGMIFKGGSGSGVNISKLRQKGAPLSNGGTASGPVSFMRVADHSAGAIKSGGGTRRAAKMVIMDADHPDIEEFIWLKVREEEKSRALRTAGYEGNAIEEAQVDFQNANHSVRVTDGCMEKSADYGSREFFLLGHIAQAAHACGDPGLHFGETINRWHTVPNSGSINSSNPCSEFFFLDNSACNLASINLLKFLKKDNIFDVPAFRHTVDILITAQDILCGRSDYPTEKIRQNSIDYRPLGLGYTNLGATLMTQGIPYDSDEGRAYAGGITSLMTAEAYLQSARLARQLGAFAGYEANATAMRDVIHMHSAANMCLKAHSIWQDAIAIGKQHGYRNAQTTLLAPTGTISFMMDAETTGIEPFPCLDQTKKMVGGGILRMTSEVAQRAAATYETDGYDHPMFQTALGDNALSWQAHVKMVAAVQPFLSGGVSKTINMPAHSTVEDVQEAYMMAWKMGLKSIAIYRDGSKTVQPVCVAPREETSPHTPDFLTGYREGLLDSYNTPQCEAQQTQRHRLPDERPAVNHKFSVDGYEGYLTVGLFDNGQPGELFLRMSKEGSTLGGLCDALGVAISLGLQYGVPLAALVEKYSQTKFEPMGMTSNADIPIAQSLVDYIFRWLGKKFLGECAVVERNIGIQRELSPQRRTNGHAPICPECGNLMVQTGTCSACPACGTSGGCA